MFSVQNQHIDNMSRTRNSAEFGYAVFGRDLKDSDRNGSTWFPAMPPLRCQLVDEKGIFFHQDWIKNTALNKFMTAMQEVLWTQEGTYRNILKTAMQE